MAHRSLANRITACTVVVVTTLLAGCGAVPRAPTETLLRDAAFLAPRQPVPSPADVFALSPAMHAFLATEAAPLLRLKGAHAGLVEALYAGGRLRLAYDAQYTRNAAQAFADQSGNCMSLVVMTAAFAKHLGLDVRFQRIDGEEVWSREGGFLQVIGHVNIALGRPQSASHRTQSPSDWITIDFLPIDEAQRQRARPITEARVLAMYFNNRGAEELAAGRIDEAYWWSRASVQADPAFISAFITLGVVLQQKGLSDAAEAATRHALALGPDNPQALSNLAWVLRASGRVEEAQRVLARLQAVEPATPMAAYKRGLIAYQRRDFAEARDAFRSALARAPDDAEFHLLMGMTLEQLGDAPHALEHLQRASQLARNEGQRRVAASKASLIAARGGSGAKPAATGR